MQYGEYVWSAYLITAMVLLYQSYQAYRQYQQARVAKKQQAHRHA